MVLFAASTLAQIAPGHRALRPVVDTWRQIACETFAGGGYDPAAEAAAHRRLTGIRGELRYLTIYNPHVARLLGVAAARDELPDRVQDGWLAGFYEGAAPHAGLQIMLVLETASALPRWRPHAPRSIAKLWSIRGTDGLWDFPPAAPYYQHRPLSKSWRRADARRHDSSVRVLSLLRRYYD